MNINEIILNALKVFEIPIEEDVYTGVCLPGGKRKLEPVYITFTNETDRGISFGDNEAEIDQVFMQISLHCPLQYNYFSLRKKMRNALQEAGFSYPEITHIREEATRNIVFQCHYCGATTIESEE